ncbi:MAG: DUF3164 family protein [Candidatus Cloacimonadaceae bacterium]|jgi:hypothetical protein|nr:DUF3164 family protein [Candidatus Cloacimonadota bacterium]
MSRKSTKAPKERTLTDAQGREISVKVLHQDIIEREAAINKAMDSALKLQERIIADKQKIISIVEDYLSEAARRNGLEWKGNALLISFNEKYRIEIRYREKIQFGIELQLAKQKIDECIKAWSADSSDNLKAIINEAFQVDKRGQLARYRIFALRRYKIKDPTWKEAMELIDKAILVTSTKQYISFAVRDEAGNYNKVVLNFSAL